METAGSVVGGSLVIECARATALTPLPGRTQSVLLLMAAHALDKPKGDKPARVYWLGHRTLALEIWGVTDWGRNAPCRTGLKRAIRELIKRGLIRVYTQQRGSVTAYELLPYRGAHNEPP